MRWVQALPPQYVAQLKQADDTMLTQFARILTQNVLLLGQADSAKINVTPEEWKGLQTTLSRPSSTRSARRWGWTTRSLGDSGAAAADATRSPP